MTKRLRLCVNWRANQMVDSCGARGARELADALAAGLAERGLDWTLERVHCQSFCHLGPTLRLLPDGRFVLGPQAEDVPRILDWLAAGDLDALVAWFPHSQRANRLLAPRT